MLPGLRVSRLLTSAPGHCTRFDDPDVLYAVDVQLWADLRHPLQHGFAAGHEILAALDLRSFTGKRKKTTVRYPEEHFWFAGSLSPLTRHSLDDEVVVADELGPLRLCERLRRLQVYVDVPMLQTL